MPEKTLYATIIGIDNYSQNPLYGCTKDALDIGWFLQQWCAQQSDKHHYKPAYFLSPGKVGQQWLNKYQTEKDLKVDFTEASFSNISTRAFSHFKQAKNGDLCVLYYSGHGSQTDAPPEFQYSKSDRKNETLVCADSRDPDKKDSRDLIDKEIAFLLWDALQGKDLHCLIIMDCCHSGNNTRSFIEGVQYRHIGSAKNKIPLEQYIGYDTNKNFYTKEGGNISFPIADYVHLAATLDFEKAEESSDGGLFTGKLVEALNNGGTSRSYRDLMQQVGLSVRNRNNAQNPVAFAAVDDKLDFPFLKQQRHLFRPRYGVRFDITDAVWKLWAGTMDGLEEGSTKTTVRINENEKEIGIKTVYSNYSILNEADMAGFDPQKQDYQAEMSSVEGKKITIGISKGLFDDETRLTEITTAYKKLKPLFFRLITGGSERPEYLIELTEENKFVLTPANSATPVFKRENDAESFLTSTESVGKWVATSELVSNNTSFSKDDFVVTIEKIEGQPLKTQNLDLVQGTKTEISPGEEIELHYREGKQPAFRLSVSIAPQSNLVECHIGALYLESKYGIKHDLIPSGTLLKKNGTPVYFRTIINNHEYKTLPLLIDAKYKLYNINEITAFLKIFVSDSPLNLEKFRQANLELDEAITRRFRSRGDIQLEPDADSVVRQAEWNVFTHKVRVIGSGKEKELRSGTEADFTAFTVKVPEGIQVKAVAVTEDDLQKKLKNSRMRGADSEADELKYKVVPPEDIWGDALVDEVPFTKGLNPSAGNGVIMLEIIPENDQPIQLKEGESIDINIKIPQVTTRSVDAAELEETVIPFGYDESAGIWFPLGYCDEDGVVHIQQLPEPTPGRISETTVPLTRSLGSSIKMFFKKIFRPKQQVNTLVLYGFKEDGSWEEKSRDPQHMAAILKQKPAGNVLLLIHGLTGDTRHLSESLKALEGLNNHFDFILTYDYENMATPIMDAATDLEKLLHHAGFGEAEMPSITILAHSQGGLLSRWLLEKRSGATFVKKLILVGVASAGSELASLGTALLGLLTHALNGPPVLKVVITGISFALKKMKMDPARTLKDTKPGSDFILELNKNSIPPGVKYAVIGGDISLLQNYDGDDPFFKRLKKALLREVVFPGIIGLVYHGKKTDIAVTLDSMQSIHGYDSTEMKIVASNHLSYFREKLIQNELMELLK